MTIRMGCIASVFQYFFSHLSHSYTFVKIDAYAHPRPFFVSDIGSYKQINKQTDTNTKTENNNTNSEHHCEFVRVSFRVKTKEFPEYVIYVSCKLIY